MRLKTSWFSDRVTYNVALLHEFLTFWQVLLSTLLLHHRPKETTSRFFIVQPPTQLGYWVGFFVPSTSIFHVSNLHFHTILCVAAIVLNLQNKYLVCKK